MRCLRISDSSFVLASWRLSEADGFSFRSAEGCSMGAGGAGAITGVSWIFDGSGASLPVAADCTETRAGEDPGSEDNPAPGFESYSFGAVPMACAGCGTGASVAGVGAGAEALAVGKVVGSDAMD